jgi:hypothetical protein
LFHQAEVVAVVPDFGDLAVLKAEDVDAREGRPAPGRFDCAPCTEMRARGRPTRSDELVLSDHDLDFKAEVWEG